jgi:hypothetical protein
MGEESKPTSTPPNLPSPSPTTSLSAMCFPSKWLKKNFSEEDRPREDRPRAAERPADGPVEKATNGTTAPAKESPRTFKTAIVIYSMYGHIASRESKSSSHGPFIVTNRSLVSQPNSCRISKGRCRIYGWECDNLPVSVYQHVSPRLAQYLSCTAECPKPFQRKSCRRCMPPLNPTIQSSPQRFSPPTTLSSSVFPLATATPPLNGRHSGTQPAGSGHPVVSPVNTPVSSCRPVRQEVDKR